MLINMSRLIARNVIKYTADTICKEDGTRDFEKMKYEIILTHQRTGSKIKNLFNATINLKDNDAKILFTRSVEWLSNQTNILKYEDVTVYIGSSSFGRYVCFLDKEGKSISDKINDIDPTFITSEMAKALIDPKIKTYSIYNRYSVRRLRFKDCAYSNGLIM